MNESAITMIEPTLLNALGWTLIHFLWQGVVIAIIIAGLLAMLKRNSAMSRYVVSCMGMLMMLIAPIATLFIVLGRSAPALDLSMIDPALLAFEDTWRSRLAAATPMLAQLWCAGVILLHVRLGVQWIRAQKLRRRGALPSADVWQSMKNELCERLGVRCAVRLMDSAATQVPVVLGWLKPVILMPASAWTGLTADQLKSVLAHELAHVRRHDYAVNLVQSIVESLLFYHPAVWWVSHRVRVEREYCCDDVAVRTCGDVLCYARALSTLDAMRSSPSSSPLSPHQPDTARGGRAATLEHSHQTVIASTGGSLMNRIFRLVGAPPSTSLRMSGVLAPAVLALTLCAAASAMVLHSPGKDHGEKPKDAPKKIEQAKTLDDIDIVALAEKCGCEKVETLRALRDRGLDNKTLISVLDEIEPNNKALKTFFAKLEGPKKAPNMASALEQKEKQLIEKMKKAGKSKAEIKDAVKELHLKFKEYQKQSIAERELKEQAIIEKMMASGASKDEIKKKIMQFRQDYDAKHGLTAPKKDLPTYIKMELNENDWAAIKKMKAKGLSEDDIRSYIVKSRAKSGQIDLDNPITIEGDEIEVLEKLKAKGWPIEKIRAYILQQRIQFEPKMKKGEKIELSQNELELIEKMKAKGMSKDEIKQAIIKMRQKDAPPPKKIELSKKEAELVERLREKGMSDDEIKTVIKSLRAMSDKT